MIRWPVCYWTTIANDEVGGETIKEMQNISGCKINVSQPSGDDIERDIGLVGTREAIEAAKMAIMDKVRAVEEKNRGGGRGGQSYQQDNYGSSSQNQGGYGQGGGGGYNNNQSYNQYSQQQSGAQASQQQQGSPQGADPYAAYGGYENYMALWYSHMQNQSQAQQQQPQG